MTEAIRRRVIAPAVVALIGLVGAVWLFADAPQQSDPALGWQLWSLSPLG